MVTELLVVAAALMKTAAESSITEPTCVKWKNMKLKAEQNTE